MSRLSLITWALLPSTVCGWNQDVHYAGAKLVEDLLPREDLDRLLQKNGDLTYYINWPDSNHRPGSMSGDSERFAWSMASHFVNMPSGEEYNRDQAESLRVMETPNAVNSLRHFREKLLFYKDFKRVVYINAKMKVLDEALCDGQNDFNKVALLERFKRESTYSIAHYFQDLHNPFHCGDQYDLGGFKHSVQCGFCADNKTTNVHTLWDADMFDHELRGVFKRKYIDQMAGFEQERYPFQETLYKMMREKYDFLLLIHPELVRGWYTECSGEFDSCIDIVVSETRQYFLDNKEALYVGGQETVVTEAYLDRFLDVAFMQVIKSSVRLAAAFSRISAELRQTEGFMMQQRGKFMIPS